MPDTTIDPQSTALLIQDMQNELVKGSVMPVQPLSGADIIANSVRLLEKARSVNMPVIYVKVNRPRRPDAMHLARPSARRHPPPMLDPDSPRAATTPRWSPNWRRNRATR